MKSLSLIVACLLLMCGSVFGKLVFVLNGQSDYDIVVRKGAPRCAQYAATELQSQVQKTTGVWLPIINSKAGEHHAIYIGAHPSLPSGEQFLSESYKEERFFISELAGGDISIMGADSDVEPLSVQRGDFGLLFGVYEFIERFLGTRWYAPGELGECIDQKKTIVITGLPIEQTPHCWGRSYWPPYWIEASKNDALVFNRRLRAFGVRDGLSSHSMLHLAPMYKESRPQIFALEADGKTRRFGKLKNDGTAHPEQRWAVYPQFCLSNPDTLSAYCESIDAFYQKRPEAKLWERCPPNEYMIPVVMNDNFVIDACFCDECQKALKSSGGVKGAKSNLVWSFVKGVAEYAQEHYPGKKVYSLAYEDYYKAPDFKLPDNVVVALCVNPYIIYQGCPLYREDFDAVITAWSQKAAQISLWHYFLPYDCIPYSMPHVMYQWFRDYPIVRSVYLELADTALYRGMMPANKEFGKQRIGSDLGQSHLNLFFAMKGMWGAELDVDAELARYYRLFYGPAEEPMKAFFTLVHDRWEHVSNVIDARNTGYAKFSGKELYENIYAPEIIEKLKLYLAEAQKLTEENSIYRKRILWLKQSYLDAFFQNADAYAAEKKASRTPVIVQGTQAPIIDGDLSDDFYATLQEYSFQRMDAPLPPRYKTTFKVGAANGKLYLGIHGEDPDGASRVLNQTSRDSTLLFTDDSIELFICPDPLIPDSFYNVAVNLNDVLVDYRVERKGTPINWAISTGARSKTKKTPTYFTMELEVPLQAVGIDTLKETAFRMNLCRNKRSGVQENREYSAWSCPYGSFWHLNDTPVVSLMPDSSAIERFRDAAHPLSVFIRTMPKGVTGPTTKRGVEFSRGNAGLRLQYIFTDENNPLDYGNCTIPNLKGISLTNDSCVELRFRNLSPKLNHMVVYAFKNADGTSGDDYFRFSSNEASDEFQTRAFNIATEGYRAKKNVKDDKEPFSPVELTFLAIYSSPTERNGEPLVLELDYIRLTTRPVK